MHGDGVLVDLGAEHVGEFLRLGYLDEDRAVGGAQHESVRRVIGQLQPAVPVHCLGDIDQQRVRHRVAGEAQKRVHDRLGVVPRRARVPQAERSEPVRVHVFRRALQFREWSDRQPAFQRFRVVDLEQQSLVGLHDEWAVGHIGSFPARLGREPTLQCASRLVLKKLTTARNLRGTLARLCVGGVVSPACVRAEVAAGCARSGFSDQCPSVHGGSRGHEPGPNGGERVHSALPSPDFFRPTSSAAQT